MRVPASWPSLPQEKAPADPKLQRPALPGRRKPRLPSRPGSGRREQLGHGVRGQFVPARCAHRRQAPRPPPRGSWQQRSQVAAGLVRRSRCPRSRWSEAPWPDLDQTERGPWSFLGPGWSTLMYQREPGNACLVAQWRGRGVMPEGPGFSLWSRWGCGQKGQGTGAGQASSRVPVHAPS